MFHSSSLRLYSKKTEKFTNLWTTLYIPSFSEKQTSRRLTDPLSSSQMAENDEKQSLRPAKSAPPPKSPETHLSPPQSKKKRSRKRKKKKKREKSRGDRGGDNKQTASTNTKG